MQTIERITGRNERDEKMTDEAILSSKNEYTIFKYDRYTIRFRSPYSLERYTQIKEWDNGYLVVMAKYSHNQLAEGGSAKFFVKENGESVLQNRGQLNEREILKIKKFIKKNYREMFLKWSAYSENGFYQK